MNVVIFGATGATGSCLVKQALDLGHFVTAVARNPEKIELTHDHLKVVQADVTYPASVKFAVTGGEAVLSAIGVAPSVKPITLYSEGVKYIIEAMKIYKVRRFIGISAAGLFFDTDKNITLYERLFKPLILGRIYEDMRRMETIIMQSGLDWTIVRPAQLTDGPLTGDYRVKVAHSLNKGIEISRADVAHFMLKQLERDKFVRQPVAIAY